eukprot:4860132-Prymnesium_polylepis.3
MAMAMAMAMAMSMAMCMCMWHAPGSERASVSARRAVFPPGGGSDGAIGDAMRSTKLLDYEEWKCFCRDFKLMDTDFTTREVALTFVWSRMRVKDITKKAKIIQLCFEDFLEVSGGAAATIPHRFRGANTFHLPVPPHATGELARISR